MKHVVCSTFVGLLLVSNIAFGACGGGGYKKSKDGNSSKDTSTVTSTATGVATNSSTQPQTQTPPASVTQNTPPARQDKTLDTVQFDAISSKLGLSESQLKDVDKAKLEITAELNRLQNEKDKAEHKYALCDGDCSAEYNKFNATSEALKNYSPKQEFEKRLAAILQPAQLQYYQSDAKETPGQAKKI